MNKNLKALHDAGVSIWLDDLSRAKIQSGELESLIAEKSVTGVTTNPTIFAAAFQDLPFQAGAKTGSAQVTGEENANAVLVCFAPYDDPQIALAIVAEQGGSGSALGTVAAQTLSAWAGKAGL